MDKITAPEKITIKLVKVKYLTSLKGLTFSSEDWRVMAIRNKVTVCSFRFMVHSFLMSYATTEALWVLISIVEFIFLVLNLQKGFHKSVMFFCRVRITDNRERLQNKITGNSDNDVSMCITFPFRIPFQNFHWLFLFFFLTS